MQRVRGYVDLFFGWLTIQHLVELANFTVMLASMAVVMLLLVSGLVPQVVIVIGCVSGGALAGAAAMWLVNMGRLDEVEYLSKRTDVAVEKAGEVWDAAVQVLNTPPEATPAVTAPAAASTPAPTPTLTGLVRSWLGTTRW